MHAARRGHQADTNSDFEVKLLNYLAEYSSSTYSQLTR
jgi:hypothetical protein